MKSFLFLFLILQACIWTYDLDEDLDNFIKQFHNQDQSKKQLVPSNKFSLDSFLKEIDELECDQEKTDSNIYKETFNELCEDKIEESAVSEIGNFRESTNSFFDFLNKNIYMPLAFKVEKKGSISEQLIDLINLNDNHVKLDKESMSTDFDSFEQQVLQHFVELEATATDPERREDIMNMMIKILRTFHIHWNSLRITDQNDRIKGETKNLMKKILQQYEIKEKFLFEIVKTIAEKIKMAYQKFEGADNKLQKLRIMAPQLLAKFVLLQYQAVINNIKFGKVHEIQFVQRLSGLGQIIRGYYLAAYKIGYSEEKCIRSADENISKKIRQFYNEYIQKLDGISQKNKNDIKYFTAIFLLKVQYINHKLFRVEGILSILSRPIVDLDVQGIGVIKLYFELKDLLMIVPQKCVSYLQLKNCAYFEINRILKYISGKYKLKRSTGGWTIYNYLIASFQDLFSRTNHMVWGNFTLFKNYYYQNLFTFQKNMRYKYLIFEDRDVTELEDSITHIISNFEKHFDDQDHLNHALIDQMENKLYYKFVQMKADFNENFPIKNNPGIISAIHNNTLDFLRNFQEKNKDKINDNFVKLLEVVKESIQQWREYIPKKMDYTVQISELPLSSPNLYPQIFHTVLQNPTDSKYDDTINNMGLDTNHQQSQESKQQIEEKNIQHIPIKNDQIQLDNQQQIDNKQEQQQQIKQEIDTRDHYKDKNNFHIIQDDTVPISEVQINLSSKGKNKQSEDFLKNSNEQKHQENHQVNEIQDSSESTEENIDNIQNSQEVENKNLQLRQQKNQLYQKMLETQQQMQKQYNLENLNGVHYDKKDPELEKNLQEMEQQLQNIQQIEKEDQINKRIKCKHCQDQNNKNLKHIIKMQVNEHPEKIVDELYKRIVEHKNSDQQNLKEVSPMYVDHFPYQAEQVKIQPNHVYQRNEHYPIYQQLLNYESLPNYNHQNKVREYMDNETQGGIV